MQLGIVNIDLKTILIGIGIIFFICGGCYVKKLQADLATAQQNMQGQNALAKDLQAQIIIKDNKIMEKQRDIDGLVVYKEKYVASEAKLSISIKENEELKKKIPGYIAEQAKLGSDLAAIQEKMKHAKTPEEYAKLQAEAKAVQDKFAEIQRKLDEAYDQLQHLNVTVQSWGFTLRLGGGIAFSDVLRPEIDLKFLFVDRFSLIAGLALNINDIKDLNGFLACTYHVDGIPLPILSDMHNLEIGLGPSYNFMRNNVGLMLVLRENF